MDHNLKQSTIIHGVIFAIMLFFSSSTLGAILAKLSFAVFVVHLSFLFGPNVIIFLEKTIGKIERIIQNVLKFLGETIGKIVRITQMEKEDFEKNKDYYREILNINSPLILGFIDKLEIDENILIAELLYLKNKKIIDIKDGKIIKLKNYECMELMYSQRIFLDMIFYEKFGEDYLLKLRKIVASEVEEISFVKEKKMIKQKTLNIISIIISFFLGIALTKFMKEKSINSSENNIFWGICFLTYWWTICFVGVNCLITNVNNKYVGKLYKRTSKGREFNQKLEGLKNYLKDYSLMDERKAKEIKIWDEYLIYSVMFGQNKKIIEEYEKYIDIK